MTSGRSGLRVSRRFGALIVVVVAQCAGVGAIVACSSDETPAASGGGDAATDNGSSTTRVDSSDTNNPSGDSSTPKDDSAAPKDGGGGDSAACPGSVVTTPGETCIGFGPKESTCDPSCGQPYGYVCFEGAPPNFAGCREQQKTTLGNTYCCPKNDCVAQPDQDTMCASTAGKPHRFQCPPIAADGGDAGFATPANGCVEKGSGSSDLEKFYCCP